MARTAFDNSVSVSETLQSAAGATGNGTAIDMRGYNTLTVTVVHATTPTATVTFEGSNDGTNYFTIGLVRLADHSTIASTDASSGSALKTGYALPKSVANVGLANFRARISAWTAGAVTVVATKSATGTT